jgi:monooxygenase
MTLEHFDVLIVGAGLSGIDAAVHLQKHCPGKRFALLEGRERLGGTWDLFRYPGIRSDSDMYTLGYHFKPWTNAKAIADGPSILEYVKETAHEHDVVRHIRYRHRVRASAWSSADAKWTVTVERSAGDAFAQAATATATATATASEAAATDGVCATPSETVQLTCNFLFMCSGYYRYSAGYTPDFAGRDSFTGRVVHPQHWTPDIDCTGKRVVVIGSGATAMTLVPSLAQSAAHVTLLQRSPTYVVARPSQDAIATTLRRWLPSKLAYGLTRWKNVAISMFYYRMARGKPDLVKTKMIGGVRQVLGAGFDVDQHFTPRYNPWDQRVCLVPDGDLFHALNSGRASMVTDQIECFTPQGIRLKSGQELAADVIVTATGLELELLGGMQVSVDGAPVDFSKTLNYKGMMYSGVPNLASVFGYTNASWTLKCDLTCMYLCRVLNQLDKAGLRQCTPVRDDPTLVESPWLSFTSGYVQRAMARYPKQGSRAPWKLYQNYARDLLSLKFSKVEDGELVFSNAA